mgnify:CR=1 FL=1
MYDVVRVEEPLFELIPRSWGLAGQVRIAAATLVQVRCVSDAAAVLTVEVGNYIVLVDLAMCDLLRRRCGRSSGGSGRTRSVRSYARWRERDDRGAGDVSLPEYALRDINASGASGESGGHLAQGAET